MADYKFRPYPKGKSDALIRDEGHEGLIFHRERGVQFSSKSFSKMTREYGIIPIMSQQSCPNDN